MSWLDSTGQHWPWIGTLATPLIGWIARRRLVGFWRSLTEVRRANERLEACRIDRDDAIRSRDFLRTALKEITEAATLVKEARDRGLLVTFSPLPSGPSNSPPPSTTSPPRRTDPREIP